MNNISVIHVIVTLDKGGAESHLKELCLELIKKKRPQSINCTVVTIKGDNFWSEQLARHGIKTINLQASSYLQLPFIAHKLLKIVRLLDADIIHAHLAPSELLVSLAKLFAINRIFPKVVASRHNDEPFFDVPLIARTVEYLCTRNASKVICISHAVDVYFQKRLTLPSNKSHVIHYGLPDCPSLPVRNTDGQPMKFLCLARLVYQKDIPLLINAFRIALPHLHPNTQLLIAGDGPDKRSILKLVKKYGLSSHIHLLGFVEDTEQLLATCNTLCLTSRYEGFGLVLLEAMRVGMPIICTAVSAIPEVVQPEYGWLIKRSKNAASQLSDAMIESQDKLIYSEKSRKARHAFATRFTVEEMASQTMTVYNDLLSIR